MSAVVARFRAELRARWRGWLGLTVLAGLLAGVVMAAAAGARRNDSSFQRLLEASAASDFLVSASHTGLRGFYGEVGRLPGVAASGVVVGMSLIEPGSDEPAFIESLASVDGAYGAVIDRPKLLAGRLPSPHRATEVLANREMADRFGLEVGTEVPALAVPADERDVSPATPVRFTVVGIGVFPDEVVPASLLGASPRLLLSAAYYQSRPSRELQFDGVALRLQPGADPDAFRREVEQLAKEHREEVGEEIFIGEKSAFYAKTERAIRPQTVALVAFAALAGAASVLVVGQTLSRQLSLDSSEYPTLRALGMTQAQVVAVALSRAAAVGIAGGALGVVVALALSPLMPIGPALVAEPEPGFAVDAAVLGTGFTAVVAVLVSWVAMPAWRAASVPAGVAATAEPAGPGWPSRLARAAAQAGLPASAAAGIRMALEPGRGRTAVPVRGTVAGAVVAVAAVVAAATFATNLGRLGTNPSLYGRGWDIVMDTQFGAVALDDVASVLADESAVAAYSGGRYGELAVEGAVVPTVGIDLVRGEVFPTLLEGRIPARSDEIVLGTRTLRRMGQAVGDVVSVEAPGGTSTMRVVGRAVFPQLGRGDFPPTGLGEGAAVIADVLPLLDFEFGTVPETQSYAFFLVRFTDDADRAARDRVAARLQEEACEGFCFVSTDERPADISNYARVQATPLLLAGLLALLAVTTMGHALVMAVRRRRRDFAVLETLGFARRQISATVAWQASTLAALALLIGLPLGVATGRWVWLAFARQLGIAPEVVVPVLAVLVTVPATMAVTNLVAAGPGWIAGRLRPAAALRSE